MKKHPSVLQTTSYNFTQSDTTSEVCVGVVKAIPIHKKNPTQHFSDLLMLSARDELQLVFKNPLTDLNKEIDCIRVDGATDEGPGHELVQYWCPFTIKSLQTSEHLQCNLQQTKYA